MLGALVIHNHKVKFVAAATSSAATFSGSGLVDGQKHGEIEKGVSMCTRPGLAA